MTLGGPGNDPRPLNEYLVSSRVRCFGGSGNVWGGKCAPLDPVDFERRDWIRHSGWPIDRAGLQPFYDRACALLELPRFGEQASSVVGQDEPLLAGRASSLAIRPRCYTRYTGVAPGDAYAAFKRSAAEHPRVKVCLHANVTAIKLDQHGLARRVSRSTGVERPQAQRGRPHVRPCDRRHRERPVVARIQRRASRRHRQPFRLARSRLPGSHDDLPGRGHLRVAAARGLSAGLVRQPAARAAACSDRAVRRRTAPLPDGQFHRDADGRPLRRAEGRNVRREGRTVHRRCAVPLRDDPSTS